MKSIVKSVTSEGISGIVRMTESVLSDGRVVRAGLLIDSLTGDDQLGQGFHLGSRRVVEGGARVGRVWRGNPRDLLPRIGHRIGWLLSKVETKFTIKVHTVNSNSFLKPDRWCRCPFQRPTGRGSASCFPPSCNYESRAPARKRPQPNPVKALNFRQRR